MTALTSTGSRAVAPGAMDGDNVFRWRSSSAGYPAAADSVGLIDDDRRLRWLRDDLR
jgi:hypothetical protein